MSIQRITISVPEETAKRIKDAAGTKPVSTWVTEVIEERLDDAQLERLWDEFYRDVNPSPAAIRRADAIFKRATKKRATPRKRDSA